MTQPREQLEPSKYWGPRGMGQAHLNSVTGVTARQAAAVVGGFAEIKPGHCCVPNVAGVTGPIQAP